jgi:xanthine dehydrogenase YagT iron-sulfur-binding subunit
MTGLPAGRTAVLAFYPREWDPARPHQLEYVESLLGIAFGDDQASIPILTALDASGELAQRYDVGREQTILLLDEEGDVRWRHAGPITNVAERELKAALFAMSPDSPSATRISDDLWHYPSRREFVAGALATAIVAAVTPRVASARTVTHWLDQSKTEPATQRVTLNVNGKDITLDIEPRVTLLDALREYAGLTGTKKGCDHGQCGACTVHVNGRRELSCMTLAVMQQGARITTVEGLASGDTLHPMQAAFIKHDGFQCGYCTPGQLMSATALLNEMCGPADSDVKESMSGNICRCGAYPGIVAAVQEVRGTRG